MAGALGMAFGIGSKIFKGIRAKRKQKKLDKKQAKIKKKEADAQKALSALIVGGTGQTSFSPSLDSAQELVFPEPALTFGTGGGKIFKPRKGLNRAGIASSFTEGDKVLESNSASIALSKLPIWAKGLGAIVVLFIGWKLFFDKKKRR